MTKPTFSVIVPIHNAVGTIDATVASVLAQTENDFELLLIDDGSVDASLARILTLAALDERVRVVSKANSGVAETRNLGAELAQGHLLAFLDADDLWHPNKLAWHRSVHADDPSVDATYAQIAFMERDHDAPEHGRTLSTVLDEALSIEAALGENPVCTMSNLVVTRRCFAMTGGFRVEMSHAEDQEWLLRAASSGHRIIGIHRLLVGYRVSDGGLSADLRKMYAGWRSLAVRYGTGTDLRRAEAIYCRYLARRALRTSAGPFEALRFVLLGLRNSAAGFLSDRRRGGLTLVGALAAPFFPTALRMRVFA